MNKFTLGAGAGALSLLIAVPVFAQGVGATSSKKGRTAPSQTCVLAMADYETTMLSNIDARTAAHKAAATAKRDALKAAAALTDDTARMDALKKAQEDFRTAMEAMMKTKDQAAMDTLKAACGDSLPMMGMGHEMGRKNMMQGHGKMKDLMKRS